MWPLDGRCLCRARGPRKSSAVTSASSVSTALRCVEVSRTLVEVVTCRRHETRARSWRVEVLGTTTASGVDVLAEDVTLN